MSIKTESLQPILIQYSSPKHKQGVRKYFSGEYKIDYGNYLQSEIRQSVGRSPHQRSLSYGNNERNQPNPEKHFSSRIDHNKLRCKTQNTADEKVRAQFYSANELQIEKSAIKLPKIEIHKKSQKPIQQKQKKHLYICGNSNCAVKLKPSTGEQRNESPKYKNAYKFKNLIKLKQLPTIRKRYTPTFVCSGEFPLPCFKVYDP